MNINTDPHILLGIVNMKLRDYYNNLDELIEVENINIDTLNSKLEEIGYIYSKEINQFVSKEA